MVKTFDAATLRKAHEDHDAELLASLYSEDPESAWIDTNNPPSRPRELRGKERIGEFWGDVMRRGMTHEVRSVVDDGERVAFQVACQYEDGTRVMTSHVCELEGGKISRETVVQAWDG